MNTDLTIRTRLARLAKGWRGLATGAPVRGVAPALAGDDAEMLARARKHEHYWYNAQKKIDLRRLEGFGALGERIRSEGRTYLHLDRLYTLWQALAGMPASASAVVEVGVFKGGSVKFIAEALRAFGRTTPVYACDTFAGHAGVDEALDGRHSVGKQFTGVDVAEVRDYLRDVPSVRLVAGDIRETADALDAERAFGLVHVDVDVYPPTKFCLERFAPRVVPGGMIVVDDYGFKTCRGAKQAVDEFAAGDPHFRLLHLITGQAVLIRIMS